MSRLADVHHEILNHKCDLDICRRATNIVVGEGPEDADIVFVGEAPGQREDAHGRPFMGSAGKFLEIMLDVVGLERTDVFITNLVKARPPKNRDPTPFEIKHYQPWLIAQIVAIRPKVIVPLGTHALAHFDSRPIAKVRGKLLNARIFPMYHPAAVLHNPSLRDTMLDDAAKLREVFE